MNISSNDRKVCISETEYQQLRKNQILVNELHFRYIYLQCAE